MNVFEAIRTRRSVRSYSSEAIPADVLGRMRQSLHMAPSAHNNQPWRFIFITDAQLRRDVAKAANDQLWMAEAPIILAACGLPEEAGKTVGGSRNSAEIDVAIAVDHLTLAAAAEGLGTCWIGAFDEAKVKRLLDVPPSVMVVVMTPLGYPATSGLIHPLDESERKPAKQIFYSDRYGRP